MRKKTSKKFVKLRQETKLLWALILALVAVLIWIAVSILSPKKEQVISPELRKLAEPLNPSLNQEILNSLSTKKHYKDAELESFSIYALIETETGGVYKLTDIVNQRSTLIYSQDEGGDSAVRSSELLREYSEQINDNELKEATESAETQE